MRSQQSYDTALQQVRRAPEDLTDEQLETLHERNPQFAKLAAAARDRHRRGRAYLAKVAEADYLRDVEQRRRAQALNVRPGDRSVRQGVVYMDPRRRG